MRKNQLRQSAKRYLNEDNRGSYRDKNHRHFVIQKVVDDLFKIGDVPPKWHALNKTHLEQLVSYWQRKRVKTSTIMKYMTVIRWFLKTISHQLTAIDNQHLGLYRVKKSKKEILISPQLLQELSSIGKLLLNIQIHFGLTLSEAMRLIPEVHIQEHAIWLTREITSNSQDRIIPLRSDFQKKILQELIALTGPEHSLITSQGYDAVRYAYRKSLETIKLPPRKSYRYLYAQAMHKQLSPLLRNYELTLLLMREMGLQSRVTLWGYLNE